MFAAILIFSYLIDFVNVVSEMNKNTFLYTAKIYAENFNISNCWVCIATPTNSGEGIPFLTIPFNASETAEWYIYQSVPRSVVTHSGAYTCENGRYQVDIQKSINLWKSAGYPLNTFSGWHQLQFNPDKKPQNLNLPTNIKQKGSICLISKDPKGIPMGNSNFTNYLDVNTAFKCTNNRLERVMRSSRITGIPNLRNNKTFEDQWLLEYIYSYSAYNGTYFICDDKAYPWLPRSWSGSCYLGYMVPAIRHVTNLLHISEMTVQRKKRSIIFRDAIFARIIPFYWEVRMENELNKITTIIQDVAEYTATVLDKISDEMRTIRTVVLQNRMALDYVLAENGGTCALIGAECCTFIPDNSEEVKDLVLRIQKEIKKLDPSQVLSLWDRICGWFGHTGMSIMRIILFSCAAGFIIYMTYQCATCIKELFAKRRGPTVRMIHTNPTAPPIDEFEVKYFC
ncbi:endogenous retrovirus group PABLB member 1 Env polyprotein-like isoform X1 [Scyliorhinus canicula]|uniref:endogenous retrovirus group PABLB member 1 Env polyprotein-like isoform X1 n=1 Tax=Scyliorhinus canicula TaxID=7830 RepID=UPI0018F6E213|nr:endogenous retrovirus group PABLB member 1 Env polyprotein-like isoform X1 [Scyliorhinus canicula]